MSDMEKLIQDAEFELFLYASIAGEEVESDNYKVIPYPYADGKYPSEEDRQFYLKEAKTKGYKLLYQIKCNDYYIIVEKDNLERIGIIPVSESNGFPC